ncbi:hypothetical protein LVJ82_00865 [Vitreoscilla massiliensis]|uniref:Secreted protein n=1 Tax=Vitreoscilla massiliensis TaxID=1689272 RepID=A0ABY4E200_9NEIS|nr:hypothetical protein [Vitreoscilla massiliensis]UOO89567.1 hypothetical protein LVJ82_00865 [Vitreoscilla massiliensis]
MRELISLWMVVVIVDACPTQAMILKAFSAFGEPIPWAYRCDNMSHFLCPHFPYDEHITASHIGDVNLGSLVGFTIRPSEFQDGHSV